MTESIRVLIVIDSLGVGGAQALLPTFVQHVDRSRFDLRVLALSSTPDNHIQQEIRHASVSCSQWNGQGLLKISRIRQLARAIDSSHTHVVHSHLLYSNVQSVLAARLSRRPVVATLHNVRSFSPRSKGIVESAVLRTFGTRVVAVSEGVRRSYTGRFGLTDSQTIVVPNAIDLSRFERISTGAVQRVRDDVLQESMGPLVVAVGRVIPPKGFAVLVRAAAQMRDAYPDARVVIAGRLAGGTDEVRAEINQLGLSDYVRLLGQRNDVAELLAAADVFVSSSLSEGAPVTHLEAMAAGTPVVATRVGGVPEIIRDGENGLLVPAGDEAQLSAAIQRVLEDKHFARRVAERGRASVREFSAESWARRIENEYERVWSSKTRRDPVMA